MRGGFLLDLCITFLMEKPNAIVAISIGMSPRGDHYLTIHLAKCILNILLDTNFDTRRGYMTYADLESQIVQFELDKKRRILTERFARTISVWVIMLGILTIGYGMRLSIGATNGVALIDVALISDLWRFLLQIAKIMKISSTIVMIVFVLCSIVLAVILTGVFSGIIYLIFKLKRLLKSKNDAELTTIKAYGLYTRFLATDKETVVGDWFANIMFGICAFAMYTICEYQKLGSTGGLVDCGIASASGLLFGAMLLPFFLMLRSFFITAAELFWKLENYSARASLDDKLREVIVELEEKDKQSKQEFEQQEMAKELEAVKRTHDETLAKARKLYQESFFEKTFDLDELTKYAVSGNPEPVHQAALELYQNASLDTYTKSEQSVFAEMAYETLDILEQYDIHTIDSNFLYARISLQLNKVQTEEEYRKMLMRLRKIQASGALSENDSDTCAAMIRALVKKINTYETVAKRRWKQ